MKVDYKLYFTFGSNMLKERLLERCPSALLIKSYGILKGYKLIFNRKGDYEDGGVASIIEDDGSVVYGLIYAMSSEDLERLDEIESPNNDAYSREEIEINTLVNDSVPCFTYIAQSKGSFLPTEKYLNWIIQGAIEGGLPEGYISYLKSIKTK